jgi:hypothetical protein
MQAESREPSAASLPCSTQARDCPYAVPAGGSCGPPTTAMQSTGNAATSTAVVRRIRCLRHPPSSTDLLPNARNSMPGRRRRWLDLEGKEKRLTLLLHSPGIRHHLTELVRPQVAVHDLLDAAAAA